MVILSVLEKEGSSPNAPEHGAEERGFGVGSFTTKSFSGSSGERAGQKAAEQAQ